MAKARPGVRAPSWPPNLGEIMQRINKAEMRSWLEPKSGDLLGDVLYLGSQAAKQKSKKTSAIYARASIVIAAATIEAITNDALATVYELMTDSIPSECSEKPPWVYFSGLSTRRMAALLKKAVFGKKRDYVLALVCRGIGERLEVDHIEDIDRLMLFRNRIVHMSYQMRPNKYKPLFTIGQVIQISKFASETARDYLDFLSFAFDEMRLPIRTIRPYRYFQDMMN